MNESPHQIDDVATAGEIRRVRIRTLLFFVACLLVSAAVVLQAEGQRASEVRASATDLGRAHLRLLGERLNASLSATYALAALVRQGHGEIKDFNRVASELLRLYPGAASLQLAPGGVIREIVPLEGNQAALGHDLLKDPQRNREAFIAVQTHKLTLAGPLDLIQGGVAAIGRLPVFLSDESGGGERFWGFTTVVLRMPDALTGVGLDRIPERGFDYALWRIHPDSAKPQIIIASGKGVPGDAVEVELGVPNGRWVLSLAPRHGWVSAAQAWPARIGAVLASALLAVMLHALMIKPIRLRMEVARQTSALRESKERFRSVLQAIPDLIWLKDPEGRYLACNRRFEEFFGATDERVIGRRDEDFVSAEQAAHFRERDRMAIEAGGPTANLEWITFASDGHRELLETIKTPLRDASGGLVGVLGVGRDITRLHELTERYRRSEARLAAAQRIARIGSWERDLDSGELYWSEEVFRLLELDPDEAAPSYEAFLERIHDDDREWVHRTYEDSKVSGRPVQVQMRLQMPDGRIKHVEMRSEFARIPDGEHRRVVGTLQETTDRVIADDKIRQQQALTRAMLSALPVGVAITDTAGRLIQFNDAALDLLMTPAGEMMERQFGELGLKIRDARGNIVAPSAAPVAIALESAQGVRDVELRFESPRGAREVSMSALPVDGEGLGVVIVLVDLSARRQSEASLRDTAERIEALNRRFAIAADAAGIGVWEYDVASQRLVWDEAMHRLHGLSPGRFDGSLAGWMECVLEYDRNRLALALQRARSGDEDLDVDLRIIRRGGDTHFVRAVARAIRAPGGSVRSLSGVCIDTTTLKRSEQILIQERRRYRDLVDSTDGIVWEADAQTVQFTYVSRHAERLLGYPIDAWYEPNFWARHIHPEDRDWVGNYCRALTDRLQAHEFEYRMIASDGRPVWLRDIVAVVAENGRPRWIRGVMVDITDARRTAEELARSEERLSMAIDGAGLGLWDWDMATGRLDIGGQGLLMLGFGSGEIEPVFSGWEDLIHPDDLARVQRELVTHLQGQSPRFVCEYRLRHKQAGRWVWVHGLGQVMLRDRDGVPLRAAGIQLDITERRIAEERARTAQLEVERLSARNALLLRSAGEGIFGVGVDRRCIFINPMALELLGLREEEALNECFSAMFQHRHEDGRPYLPEECPIFLTLADGVTRQVEDVIARRDGRSLAVRMTVTEMQESGERVGVEVVFQDVSIRREMERELERMATTDPLTGVTNRRQFIDRCEQELQRMKRFGDPVSLLMIDVDHFKRVNDSYGHAVGDAVLKHLAELALEQLRRTDVFARIGGEEFAFLLAGSGIEGALDFAARFRGLVEGRPAPTDRGSIGLTISIGAAQGDRHDQGADDLLRRADAALYRAKASGRNRVEAESEAR